ncbi:hypothetical protein TSUD_202530 [Trifolium subterraneum]|uniref:Uncharacterized protein n=1 Tax=Trifolium subterraneum TaxID=3900 RepID=A0A2Z6LLG2_TRISU|nr:hypothetical protein TSUD_202530 [Trifolium subterraneum]
MIMSAPAPVAIGTRGTIGSLVRKEIEYFTSQKGNSKKSQPQFVNMVSSKPKASFWMLLKRKKQRNPNEFLPKTCSVRQVTENNHCSRIPGYSYRILKDHDFN